MSQILVVNNNKSEEVIVLKETEQLQTPKKFTLAKIQPRTIREEVQKNGTVAGNHLFNDFGATDYSSSINIHLQCLSL